MTKTSVEKEAWVPNDTEELPAPSGLLSTREIKKSFSHVSHHCLHSVPKGHSFLPFLYKPAFQCLARVTLQDRKK